MRWVSRHVVCDQRPDPSTQTPRTPLVPLSIVSLFCCRDDFTRVFEDWERRRLIPTGRTRGLWRGKPASSEMLFILTLFHLSPFRDFTHFWIYGIGQKYRGCFCVNAKLKFPKSANVKFPTLGKETG